MKKLVSLILALAMCLTLCATAFAETTTPSHERAQTEESETTEPTRAEETEWYYRVVNNYYVQRRLWSITYGYWLTEWETIGYINPNP